MHKGAKFTIISAKGGKHDRIIPNFFICNFTSHTGVLCDYAGNIPQTQQTLCTDSVLYIDRFVSSHFGCYYVFKSVNL